MIPTNEYNKDIKIGDLIWFHKDNAGAYGAEDIGYVSDIFFVKGLKKYSIVWMKSPDEVSYTQETVKSIIDMDNSYIIQAL